MAEKSIKKPINYYYNPYYFDSDLVFVEVWQVLEDDVLGRLYPWQYTASAETSKRIETLNFYALNHFNRFNAKHTEVNFIYKLSSRLLTEGNVQRLSNLIQPNLFMCFDIYNLEKLGEKLSTIALKYLIKRGARIIIEGIERAPIDVIAKYPTEFFMLDYRYFNSKNFSLLSMLKQIARTNNIRIMTCNVGDDKTLDAFHKADIRVFSGSYFNKPRKRLDSLLKDTKGAHHSDHVPLPQAIIE